tara:strand:- start:199 stop:372 length:174 start_codon:yes stop_codon:yes gene_type:complete
MSKWYKIVADDSNMSNITVEFHLSAPSESEVKRIIINKGYINIQSIEEDKDFENNLK